MEKCNAFRSKFNWRLVKKEDKGATAVEYALIVGGLAVVIIAAVGIFGDGITTTFNRIACQIQSDMQWTGGQCVSKT